MNQRVEDALRLREKGREQGYEYLSNWRVTNLEWPTPSQSEWSDIATCRARREDGIKKKVWIDVSEHAKQKGLALPTCISTIAAFAYDESVIEPEFNSTFLTIFDQALERDVRFASWRVVVSTKYGLPPYYMRFAFTTLEDGEDVRTIFEDPEPPMYAPSIKTGKRLPTIDELVTAVQEVWWHPDLLEGEREPIPPVVETKPYYESAGMELNLQKRREPAAVALVAQDLGMPWVASECWLLAGDLDGALDCLPTLQIGSKNGYLATYRACLSLVLGLSLLPADVFALFGTNLTAWGRSHPDHVIESLQMWLDSEESRGSTFESCLLSLKMPWKDWIVPRSQFGVLTGLRMPEFHKAVGGADRMKQIHRQVEDAARELEGFPLVGQGWISETEVFKAILNAFGERTRVIQHGHPEGFGRQHLDVWIPEWKIGIEFQGLRHDQPVAYFGGKESWKRIVALDALKRKKCRSLGITLIEVRSGYDMAALLNDIKEPQR